jgi:hypothetical protein
MEFFRDTNFFSFTRFLEMSNNKSATTAVIAAPVVKTDATSTVEDDEDDDNDNDGDSGAVFKSVESYNIATKQKKGGVTSPKKLKKMQRKAAKKKSDSSEEATKKKKDSSLGTMPASKLRELIANPPPPAIEKSLEETMFEDNRSKKQKRAAKMAEAKERAKMNGMGLGKIMSQFGGTVAKAMNNGDTSAGMDDMKRAIFAQLGGAGMKSAHAKKMFDQMGPAAMEAAKESLFGSTEKAKEIGNRAISDIEAANVVKSPVTPASPTTTASSSAAAVTATPTPTTKGVTKLSKPAKIQD